MAEGGEAGTGEKGFLSAGYPAPLPGLESQEGTGGGVPLSPLLKTFLREANELFRAPSNPLPEPEACKTWVPSDEAEPLESLPIRGGMLGGSRPVKSCAEAEYDRLLFGNGGRGRLPVERPKLAGGSVA